MNCDLSRHRAMVGGSTQGIGLATAKLLARNGAEIVLLSRDEDALKKAVFGLENGFGQNHSYIVADFTSPAELEKALKGIDGADRTVDILINNTGGPPGGPIHEADPEAFRIAFNMHLICNQIIVKSFLQGMKTKGWGRVVNVISTSVKIPLKGLGVSNTIRGAVASWSKTMANEVGAWGITVNNVLPGATSTARLASIIRNKSEKSGLSAAEVEAQMKTGIPAARFAEADEIAHAILFLCSEEASYINGVSLPVDGGRTGSL